MPTTFDVPFSAGRYQAMEDYLIHYLQQDIGDTDMNSSDRACSVESNLVDSYFASNHLAGLSTLEGLTLPSPVSPLEFGSNSHISFGSSGNPDHSPNPSTPESSSASPTEHITELVLSAIGDFDTRKIEAFTSGFHLMSPEHQFLDQVENEPSCPNFWPELGTSSARTCSPLSFRYELEAESKERGKVLTTQHPSKSKAASPLRLPHKMVEKRYRNKLNKNFAALSDCLPSSCHNDSMRADNRNEAKTLNKATILTKAIEYIAHLERKSSRLAKEKISLKANLEFPNEYLFSRSDSSSCYGSCSDSQLLGLVND